MKIRYTRVARANVTFARKWLVALGIGLVATSCQDAPNAPLNSGHRPSFNSINAPGVVTVSPDSMHGWALYDDQAGSACSDTNLCNLVDGPVGAPSGTGSAELAVLSTAEGKALIIPDYGGVRLDQVTTLSYSTYRQTVDNGNNLAIALQLNVDYDLSDASTGYQGRLVYEPYQTSGGQVLQSTWQTWDAMAGKWWGTRASVVRNGQTVANPCVQSSPCTWTQVLTYFPNIGVHATMGAIVLKAGSGWANFRGNVDNFVIGINGSTTTFDFEQHAAVPHLRTEIGPSVVSARVWPADTVYSSGVVVNYSFSARPGRAAPIVVLDDTLAALSGQFVMNSDHALRVESDTIYSYATLQPLERSIADLQRNLLTSSDKVGANQAIIDFHLAEMANGVDPEELERASAVASYVTANPVRDSAAIAAVNAALTNENFYVDLYSDGSYATYNELGTPGLGSLTSVTPLAGARRTPADFRPARSLTARRIGQKGPGVSRSRIAVPSKPSNEALANPDQPAEFTYIVVTNGIYNDFDEAHAFLGRVASLAKSPRTNGRFEQDYTTIVLHYNRTHDVEMRDWDNAHPCANTQNGLPVTEGSLLRSTVEFQICMQERDRMSKATDDLLESWRLRQAAILGLPEDHVETKNLTDMIRLLRDRYDSHVILVEHSEGTIIGSNALRALPAAEGHPLNVANRCVAVLGLAPAVPRATFGLDDYHLIGLTAEHDVLRLWGITNAAEWESITTPLGDSVTAEMARIQVSNRPLGFLSAAAYERGASFFVHQWKEYLSRPQNSNRFVDRLVTLHKECVAGSGTLSLTPSTAPVGSTMKAEAHLINENGRELLGRRLRLNGGSALQQIDSVTFLAYEPTEFGGLLSRGVEWNLRITANFDIPLVSVPNNLAVKDSVWWIVIGGSNGGLGSPAPGPVPTGGGCGEQRHVPGEGTSYVDYESQCATFYHVSYTVPTMLPSGLPIRAGRATWKHLDGTFDQGDDAACGGGQPCIESVKVELIDSFGVVVGRTTTPVP